MPSGRIHDRITIISLPLVALGGYLLNVEGINFIILLTAHLFASFMFNGDLDLESSPYYRWWIFRFIWKPYQKLIPHRSILSHGIIIGTLVRLLYLAPVIIPIMLYFGFNPIEIAQTKEFMFTVIGLELGSALHTIADYTL